MSDKEQGWATKVAGLLPDPIGSKSILGTSIDVDYSRLEERLMQTVLSKKEAFPVASPTGRLTRKPFITLAPADPLSQASVLNRLTERVDQLVGEVAVAGRRDPLLQATNEVLLEELKLKEEENARLRRELAGMTAKLEAAHVRLYKTIDTLQEVVRGGGKAPKEACAEEG